MYPWMTLSWQPSASQLFFTCPVQTQESPSSCFVTVQTITVPVSSTQLKLIKLSKYNLFLYKITKTEIDN